MQTLAADTHPEAERVRSTTKPVKELTAKLNAGWKAAMPLRP
jgi:hypothetical protein